MEGMSMVYVVVAVVMIMVGIVIGGCRSRVWFCITEFEMLVRHLRKDSGQAVWDSVDKLGLDKAICLLVAEDAYFEPWHQMNLLKSESKLRSELVGPQTLRVPTSQAYEEGVAEKMERTSQQNQE